MFDAGVHHVSINVHDAEVATRLYTGVLGMAARDDRPEFPMAGTWLQSGDQEIHLVEVADFIAPVGQHFALRVADLDAARAHLHANDVQVSKPSRVGDLCLQSFFKDPTGNLIELNQPL